MARAWGRHPVVAFLTHGSRLAFYRQLKSLLASGMGLPVAFGEMQRYAGSARLRNALAAVNRDVAGGDGLAESMARHADLFDDATIELLVFAEEAGRMEEVLGRIIAHVEEVHRLRWTAIFGALWPLYLIGAFVFVGPLFGIANAAAAGNRNWFGVYAGGLGANLVVAIVCTAGMLAAPFVIAVFDADAAWDRIKLAVPGLGAALRRFYGARMFLSLGLGLSSGLEVGRALRLAVKGSGSATLTKRVDAAEAGIREGGTLVDAVESFGVFERTTLGTIAVGERTGRLEEALAQAARDAQEAGVRAVKVLILAVLAVVAAVVLVLIVRAVFGTLFGPIFDYYRMPNSID